MRIKKQCPVCGETINRGFVGLHFRTKHPEYKWTRKTKPGNVGPHYYCDICDCCLNSFDAIFKHYNAYHPEALRSATIAERTGVLSEKNLAVTDLDRLIEQVNINVGLLQEERQRNRELLQKCTAYAARIVELQNQIAQETKNRY